MVGPVLEEEDAQGAQGQEVRQVAGQAPPRVLVDREERDDCRRCGHDHREERGQP